MKLTEILTQAEQRPAVVRDCVALLDAEVANKRGVSGLAIKAGYKVVKTVKPGLIAEAFNDLLDDFAARLDRPTALTWRTAASHLPRTQPRAQAR